MFGRIDIGTVNLVNLTNGGEGCVGYIHTNESKNKIKEHWANYRGFDLPENIEDYKKEYNRRYSRKYRENDIIKEKCRKYSKDKYHNMSDIEKEEHKLKKRIIEKIFLRNKRIKTRNIKGNINKI